MNNPANRLSFLSALYTPCLRVDTHSRTVQLIDKLNRAVAAARDQLPADQARRLHPVSIAGKFLNHESPEPIWALRRNLYRDAF